MKTPARKQETGRRDAKTSRRPVSADSLRQPPADEGDSGSKPPAHAGGSDSKPPAHAGGSDSKSPAHAGGSDSKPPAHAGGSDSKPPAHAGGSDSKPPAHAGGSDSKPPAHAGGSDSRPSGVITLLTDFGTADYFVAAVKGVILASNPTARIVDITHEIAPHDIETGAFTLMSACTSFPAGTVHVAVVDPGVGSLRRPLLIQASGQFFVGPDNGIFSYVYDRSTRPQIFHLTNSEYFRHPVSPTFNGRDIFAPVAAALSTGINPEDLGEKIEDYVKLKPLKTETSANGEIVGRIIHVDRFGNCVTNITPVELTPEMIAGGAKLRVKRKLVKSFRSYFAEDTGSKDKVFAIWGSAGFLELVAAQDSAAKVLHARRGDALVVSLGPQAARLL